MNSLRKLLFVSVGAVAISSVGLVARADIPPECSSFSGDPGCSAASVGSACPGGGTCAAISCNGPDGGPSEGPFGSQTIYNCVECDTVIADPGGVCGHHNSGESCGDGGTCSPNVPNWCPGAAYSGACVIAGSAPGTIDAGVDSGADETIVVHTGDAGIDAAPDALVNPATDASTDATAPTSATISGGKSGCAMNGGDGGAIAGVMLVAGVVALLGERRRR